MNKFIENDIYHLQEHMKSCKNCIRLKNKASHLIESSYTFFMKRLITNAAVSLVVILILIEII